MTTVFVCFGQARDSCFHKSSVSYPPSQDRMTPKQGSKSPSRSRSTSKKKGDRSDRSILRPKASIHNPETSRRSGSSSKDNLFDSLSRSLTSSANFSRSQLSELMVRAISVAVLQGGAALSSTSHSPSFAI